MATRRSFLGGTAAALVAGDRIRLGVIGSGARGTSVMGAFLSWPDCSVPAVCDVYRPNAEKAAAKAGGAEIYGDYRRLLERKDIDAVLIATPDHWHCPIVVDACRAGKDVYVEKPLSNAVEPCRAAIAAAREHRRVVQMGVQQRSTPHFQEAAKLVRDGLLGRLRHAAMLFPGNYGRVPEAPAPPPEGLDWEMFQGPAPRRPYTPARQHNWRAYYDYGGGLVTDWGVHLLDVAHWYTADDAPVSTAASSQYVAFDDPQQVPDAFAITWAYGKFVASFSNWAPNWTPPEADFTLEGNYFAGDRGTMFINRAGYIVRPLAKRGAAPDFAPVTFRRQGPDEGTRLHVRNFLDCVRSREKPAAGIETGFNSTAPLLAALRIIERR